MGDVLIAGFITGLLYALSALALVVVYRSSRVINFALGGMGGLCGYLLLSTLKTGAGYVLGLVVAGGVGLLLGVAVQIVIVRPLRGRAHMEIGVVTLGALLIFQGIIVQHWGTTARSVRPLVGGLAKFGGITVSWNELLVGGISLVCIVALFVLVELTPLGLKMRAVSLGPEMSEILGVSVVRIDLLAWGLGGVLGGLAAALIAPLTYLDPQSYTNFLFLTFIAIVLGGITDMRGVLIGGIVYGVAIDLFQTYVTTRYNSTFTFVLVAAVLVFRPEGLFGRHERGVAEVDLSHVRRAGGVRRLRSRLTDLSWPVIRTARSGPAPTAASSDTTPDHRVSGRTRTSPTWSVTGAGIRWRLHSKAGGWILLLAVVLIAPLVTSGGLKSLLPSVLAVYIGVLGLNVVSGWSGQVSVCQGAFFAVGGYVAVYVATTLGITPMAALPFGIIGGGVGGALLGLPATRLRSYLYLALLTTVFAFAVPELASDLTSITGGTQGKAMVLPGWMQSADREYYFYALLALAATVALVVIQRSGIGERWVAVRDSERGARAVGIRPSVVKLGAFALAGAYGGFAGALAAMDTGFISPETYTIFFSVYLFVAVIIGGNGSVSGALIGAAFIQIVPLYTGTHLSPDVVYGIVLVVVMLAAPNGIAGLVQVGVAGALERLGSWPRFLAIGSVRPSSAVGTASPPSIPVGVTGLDPASLPLPEGLDLVARPETAAPLLSGSERVIPAVTGNELLRVEGLSAGYGRAEVLHQVSLSVGVGAAVAIVGANGAGKSTLLRTIAGILPSEGGSMNFDGRRLGGSPHHRAHLGISYVIEGRGIYPDLSVEENLKVSLTASGSRRDGSDLINQVYEWFPRLVDLRRRSGGALSGGEQQMLAVGRALCTRPKLLLLDEPSLGLSPMITKELFERLRTIKQSGVSILLVEQNVALAIELSEDVYVMARGHMVRRSASSDIRNDSELMHTYMGEPDEKSPSSR